MAHPEILARRGENTTKTLFLFLKWTLKAHSGERRYQRHLKVPGEVDSISCSGQEARASRSRTHVCLIMQI